MQKLGCLCFMLVTAGSGSALAQGLYLPSDKSGVGAAAGVSLNEESIALSLGGGYSWRSFIDGGVFLHRYEYDEVTSANVTAIGVQPYVNVHLLKQSDTVPLSVAVMGNFQKFFFSERDDQLDINGYSLFGGGSVYRRFGLSPTVSMTPQAVLGIGFRHRTGTAGAFGTVKTDEPGGVFQLATNFGYQSVGSNSRLWVLNPYLAYDNALTVGVTLGAVFF
jgi:hypothetical protein